jgi:parallel beta-helix repeat protein
MERQSFSVPIVVLFLVLASLLVSVPAFPTTYVVDPAGDDANPGDVTAPWRTIQYAASAMSPGDTVTIHPGTYRESVNVSRSGASGGPITFIADPGAVLVSPDPSASREAFNVLEDVSFITLHGIEATGGFDETIFLRSGSHDIAIEGCDLHQNHAGIVLGDAYNVTVQGCVLHDNSGVGMRIAGTSHGVTVIDTESFRNGDPTVCSAIVDGFAAAETTQDITLQRTRSYQNGGDGYDFKGDQIVLDDIQSFGNACTGVKLWQSASVHNCVVYGNARGMGIGSIFGDTAASINNCTIAYNNGVGMDLEAALTAGASYSVDLVNSIIAGDFKALQYSPTVRLSESHNILFRTSLYDAVLAPTRGRRFTDHDVNTGLWARRSGQGQGTLAVNPLFVDPANADFHVKPVSAAVGRGANEGNGPLTNIGAFQLPSGPENGAPFADPGRDRVGRTHRTFRFVAAGSVDPDGDPITYSWEFGDGTASAAGYRVSHAYAAPGRYAVTLTVSDGSLSGSTLSHLTVR